MVDIRAQGASIFAHSRRGQGKKVVERRFAEGREYEPAPYGFNLAESDQIRMSYSEDDFPLAVNQKVINRLHADPLHALVNVFRMRRADAIWTMLEWEWISVALLQRLHLVPKVPIIANSVWLLEFWPGWSGKRRRLLRWLMSDNLILTVHANTCLRIAEAFIPDRDFRLSYFGISTRAFPIVSPSWRAAEERPIRIYAIGNDLTRDWKTLMEAFGNDTRFEVRLVCGWADNVINPDGYFNLQRPLSPSIAEQRENYDWADIFVVPMKDNVFSGITVALEAVARGKPVISSRTGGVPTYFAETEVAYVEPGDAAGLRAAALSGPSILIENAVRAQERFAQSGYSAAAMMGRYINLTNEALSRRVAI